MGRFLLECEHEMTGPTRVRVELSLFQANFVPARPYRGRRSLGSGVKKTPR
jgi:hypothetical protein